MVIMAHPLKILSPFCALDLLSGIIPTIGLVWDVISSSMAFVTQSRQQGIGQFLKRGIRKSGI
jgi:hypothetical protein